MKNLHPLDRMARLAAAIVLAELAYFWLAGPWMGVVAAASLVLLLTGLAGFCPLYRLLGLRANGSPTGKQHSAAVLVLAGVVLLGLLIGGSYASAFFSRKLFLEEFNAMNHFYKQTLFLTGKAERAKAIAHYDQLMPAYSAFQAKYSQYRPHALRSDPQLNRDLETVARMLRTVEPLVRSGDLHQAHLDLEQVRPVFQEMFKRNGFSMMAVALVDFHDAMELIMEAAQARDAGKAVALYPQVSDKLAAVEAEAKDSEIEAIRANLDALLSMARDATQKDKLPGQAEQLKSSFVKVYLKRG